MQRSISDQKSLGNIFLYVIAFILYESLSSIYLFLPPLFGVLFVLLVNALDNDDTFFMIVVAFCLVIFEADKGYILFSSVVYFLLVYRFVLPKLIQNFSCYSCIKISYILFAYIGFYFFNLLLANIFLLPIASINYYVIYYIVIEFLIVSLL
jgi:hypothetical protein